MLAAHRVVTAPDGTVSLMQVLKHMLRCDYDAQVISAAQLNHQLRDSEELWTLLAARPVGARERSYMQLYAHLGNTERLSWLAGLGASWTAHDAQGATALMAAAGAGHAEAVQLVASHTVDLSAHDSHGRGAAHYAAAAGQLGALRTLYDAGADVEQKDKRGWNVLMTASASGHAHCVKFLCDKEAHLDVLDEEGRSALALAITGGHGPVALELIRRNADVNARRGDGSLGVNSSPVVTAAEAGLDSVVKALCAHPKINLADAVQAASHLGLIAELQSLIKRGEEAERLAELRLWGALMRAAEQGHEDVLRELLKHDVDVNARNYCGESPILIAALAGQAECVELLAKHGVAQGDLLRAAAILHDTRTVAAICADPHAAVNARHVFPHSAGILLQAESHGGVPSLADVASRFGPVRRDEERSWERGCTAILFAAAAQYADTVKELCAHPGIDATDALCAAAGCGLFEEVRALCGSKGLDVNAADCRLRTPLQWAAYRGHAEVAAELIAHGADVSRIGSRNVGFGVVGTGIPSPSLFAPLSLAVLGGHTVLVRLLCKHGADPEVVPRALTTGEAAAASEAVQELARWAGKSKRGGAAS